MTTEPMPTGRLALSPTQQALARSLFEKLTAEELAALAKTLPFADAAANALWPRIHRLYEHDLEKLVGDGTGFAASSLSRRWLVAAYCAAAANHALSQVLNEMVRLAERKKAMLDGIMGVIHLAGEKELPLLTAAIKGKTTNDEGHTEDTGADA